MSGVDVVHWNPRRNLYRGRRLPLGRRTNNFGDLIGPFIVARVAAEHGLKRAGSHHLPRPRLLTVGSILHLAVDGDTVWGSGVRGGSDDVHNYDSLDVRAVRGPLTRDFLMRKGIEVPEVYGDPGLLLPRFLPELETWSRRKKRTVLHVPNFAEVDFRPLGSKQFVNPRAAFLHVLRTIAESEYVIASSLHAIVVADSLGIPARLLRSGAESMFKYADYYLGTGRQVPEPAPDVRSALAQGPPQAVRVEVPDLMARFPVDLWR